MRFNSLLLTLILSFITPQLFSQEALWQRQYGDNNGLFTINGYLLERDQSFVCLTGRMLYEDSYYLELDKRFPMPYEGSVSSGTYFHVGYLEDTPTPYYIGARRGSEADGKIYVNVVSIEGDSISPEFVLDENLGPSDLKGPAAITHADQSTLIFGREHFYKINSNANGEITIEWTKNVDYGLIAAADTYGNNYILCSENGKLIRLDAEGEEVWVKDLTHKLYDVHSLEDGFILAAQVEDQIALIKTDPEGEILWEATYGNGKALSVDQTDEEGFILTGQQTSNQIFTIKTSSTGSLLWEKDFSTGFGTVVLQSKFGGYLLLGKNLIQTKLFRLDEEGNTGELKEDFNPYLDINNIKTSTPYGTIPWSHSYPPNSIHVSDDPNYCIQTEEGNIPTITFLSNIFSGIDSTGNFYSYIHPVGALPGPEGTLLENAFLWAKAWRINKSEILSLRQDMEDGILDKPVLADLLTYPGTGNPYFDYFSSKEVAVPEDAAPFVDVNGDDIYNVFDGDYPVIKGDELLWWIFTYQPEPSESQGTPEIFYYFPFEVRNRFYAYECNEYPLLKNASFLEINYRNLSEIQYLDTYVGTIINFDIGCQTDDYLGTLINTNSIYGYNADEFDDLEECYLSSFSENNLPLQSVTQLNNQQVYSSYQPEITYEYIPVYLPPIFGGGLPLQNILKGKWADGIPMTTEGYGYHPGEKYDITNFAFPGNPADPEGWSMCAEELLPSPSFLMTSSTGPKIIAPNDEVNIHLGLLTHQNIDYPCPNTDPIEAEILQLQALYDSGNLDFTLYLGPDQTITPGEVITLDAGAGASEYSWSTGANTQSIEVTDIGTYTVTVTTVTGCTYTDEITINGSTNTNEVQSQAPKVFPNPATGQVFVELFAEVPARITLENTLGQVMQSFTISAADAHSNLALPLQNTATGMYLLRFHYLDKPQSLLRKLVITE